MKNYFYKINSKYIENFSRAVISRFRNENIRSDRTFLRSLFKELNRLFSYLGSRVATKRDIPCNTDYPDSNKHNKLLEDIAIDIDKLYTAQKLVEDDVNNLLNFNSTQRLRTFENLTSTQQKVYSVYIKNKKIVGGEVVIPAENPFSSSDNLDDESNKVHIDETRHILTLAHDTTIVKPVDLNNVKMFVSSELLDPKFKIYPNNKILEFGSHWAISESPEAHHIDATNKSDLDQYKTMLIDDPNSNTGIGWCEFETVRTIIKQDEQETKKTKIKEIIGKYSAKDGGIIYLDIQNSLQGKYISDQHPGQKDHKYKLTIPFLSDAPLTNEIVISFEPNPNGSIPKVNWNQSRIFSDKESTDFAYKFIPPASEVTPENGEYKFVIKDGFIKPSRAEIILEYGSDSEQWIPIEWYMGYWVYTTTKSYNLSQEVGAEVNLILSKSYDIYVDSEPDKDKEKARALNVLIKKDA